MEDVSTPVGDDAAALTTPHQSNSTSYWYRVTDETGTTDSPAVFVEVLQPEGVRVELTAPFASYTQFGSADETLSDPINGFWSPGNQEAFIVWDFDHNRYLMGAGPYAALKFSIAFAPEYSLGSFRLKYLADSDRSWRPFQFGGGSSSDGATMFQQNQPYFSDSTIQITDPAPLGRVDYRVNVHDSAVPGKIRQVRLDAIKGDPHLPSSGPGRGFNGVFEITEAAVIDMTGPPLSIPNPWHLTSDVVKGLPFRLSINSVGELWASLAPEYHVEYEWYEGASGDLSHPLGTTTANWIVLPGINGDTPYWVRVTTVNGSTDSDTAIVSPRSVPATTILAGPVINPANGHLYYLLTPAPWPQSEEAAVSLGGHLVTINDAAENDWVYNTFKALLIGANGGNEVLLWLGLNDSKTEGVFTWSSGEPAQFRNWTVGEPNNHLGVEHYVDMDATTPPAAPLWALGQWEDAAADDFRGWRKYGVVEIDSSQSSRVQWNIGVRDMRSSEFSQENNRTDAAPGKATRIPADPAYDPINNPPPDDDYYFAGDYPAGFNSLSAPLHLPFDEPLTA
ncbi:MAG: C-type lectin domain-containing protein [Verrucomicrobiota bacterium]